MVLREKRLRVKRSPGSMQWILMRVWGIGGGSLTAALNVSVAAMFAPCVFAMNVLSKKTSSLVRGKFRLPIQLSIWPGPYTWLAVVLIAAYVKRPVQEIFP